MRIVMAIVFVCAVILIAADISTQMGVPVLQN